MKKETYKGIGLVDEIELKKMAGAGEVTPRTTVPCGAAIVTAGGVVGGGVKYTLQDSANSCPTGQCTSKC